MYVHIALKLLICGEEEMHLTSLEVLFPSSEDGQWEKKYHHPYCSWGTPIKCFFLRTGPRVQDAILYQCVGVRFFCQQDSPLILINCLTYCKSSIAVETMSFFPLFLESSFFLVVVVSAKRTFEHVSQRERLSSEVKNFLRKVEGAEGTWLVVFLVILLSFPNCIR